MADWPGWSAPRSTADWQSAHPNGTLAGFVDYLDAYQAAGGELPTSVELTEDVEGVRLMTLYQAKGLEFRYVFIPGLLDKYLGKTGYAAQQYDGAADPNRPNNLWEPLPGDHGAHGDFDSRAHKRSWQLTLNMNRRWIGLGILAAGAVAAFFRNRESITEFTNTVKEKVAA